MFAQQHADGAELVVDGAHDVPGTTRAGYEIDGNQAYPAARKVIGIGPEGGFVTRRRVIAPLAR